VIHVQNILYATDFSPFSNQAYFHAIALAESHRASLTVLYVCPPATGAGKGRDAEMKHWREQLEQIRPTNQDIPVRHVLLEGDPADEIVRYALDAASDLIVMGTHGRTGVRRLLMGSVAEMVLREAPCSVLVVKMAKRVPVVEPNGAAVALSPA
jgi:nucleotide-binding universal stress UspA family protein